MIKYPVLPNAFFTDLLGFHAFFLSVVRFAVEKHGGFLKRHPAYGTPYVDFPEWAEEACLRELANILGPGKVLQGYLSLLSCSAHLDHLQGDDIVT